MSKVLKTVDHRFNRIKNLGAPVEASDATNREYTHQLVAADFRMDAGVIPDGPMVSDPGSGYYTKTSGTGGAAMEFDNGFIVNSVAEEAAYTFVSTRRRVEKLTMNFELVAGGGTDAEDCTMALVLMRRSQDADVGTVSLAHLIVTQSGWAIQKWVDGTPSSIDNASFATPLQMNTPYEFSIGIDFGSGGVTLTDPYGDPHVSYDADLLTNWGRHFYFEIVEQADSPKGKISLVEAVEERNVGSSLAISQHDFWRPNSLTDGTPALAENIEGGRYNRKLFNSDILTSGVIFYAGGMVLPGGVPINRITYLSGDDAAVGMDNHWVVLIDRHGLVIGVTEDKVDEAWPAATYKEFEFAEALILDGPTAVYSGLMVKADTVPTIVSAGIEGNYLGVLINENQMSGSGGTTGHTTPVAVDGTRRTIDTPSIYIPYVWAS